MAAGQTPAEQPKPADTSDTLIEGSARVSASGVKNLFFSRDGLIVGLLLLFGFPNLAAHWTVSQVATEAKVAIEQTQQAAVEAKKVAAEKTAATQKTAEQIEHELKNGLADRIAAKVNKNTTEQIAPIKKRLDAIERFLTGDEAAIPKPDVETLVKPE